MSEEAKPAVAGQVERRVRRRADAPKGVDWLGRFMSKQGMGACICEGQEINAAVAEIESLRADLAAFRAMVFTNGDRKMTMDGRVFSVHEDGFISDNNFDFDAGLQVSGDFVDDEKRQYAEMIAAALNAPNAKVQPRTEAHESGPE